MNVYKRTRTFLLYYFYLLIIGQDNRLLQHIIFAVCNKYENFMYPYKKIYFTRISMLQQSMIARLLIIHANSYE